MHLTLKRPPQEGPRAAHQSHARLKSNTVHINVFLSFMPQISWFFKRLRAELHRPHLKRLYQLDTNEYFSTKSPSFKKRSQVLQCQMFPRRMQRRSYEGTSKQDESVQMFSANS